MNQFNPDPGRFYFGVLIGLCATLLYFFIKGKFGGRK